MNDSQGSCRTLSLGGGEAWALLQAKALGDPFPKMIRREIEIHLKDSPLNLLRRLELYLSDPDVRDAIQNGTAGITPQQGQALLHVTYTPSTDIENGRLVFSPAKHKPTIRSIKRQPKR